MKRIILKYIVPLILIFVSLYLILSQYKREQVGLFTIIKYYSVNLISGSKDMELLAGHMVTGKFIANENNLGTVAVRFNTFWRINDDWLIFRIKNIFEKDWYYSAKYKVDQFQNYQMFPFGFPEIKDSLGNTFIFEIESTQGTPGNAVAISSQSPGFHARYRFPKESILGLSGTKSLEKIFKYNIKSVLDYLMIKLSSNFTDLSTGIVTIIYFSPVILYLLYYNRKITFFLIVLVFLLILEIFFLDQISDSATLILFTGIITYLYLSKKSVTFFAYSGFITLISSAISYYASDRMISDKLGSWSYLLFFLTFIKLLISKQIQLNNENN